MKYIIDIEDKPFTKKGEVLYKAKCFNSLVFDEKGLNKMKPFETEAFEILEEVSRLFKKQDEEKEAKAERIFKELGYTRFELKGTDNNNRIQYKKKQGPEQDLEESIDFDIKRKRFAKKCVSFQLDVAYYMEIESEELKAIVQQCRELGWLSKEDE